MTSKLGRYWRALAKGERAGILDQSLLAFLIPFSLVYALAQRLRALMYQTGLLTTKRLPRPVLSVGNLAVGGAGKTPVTAYIARFFLGEGHRVAVLSRGYGGSMEGRTTIVSDGKTISLFPDQCGDEPYLLASTIPGLMVVIGANRYEAGALALKRLSPDIFILDDGFQHLRLHRDLNILLLDYARPFGNGRTLPAGILREPMLAARRADLLIQTRCPEDRERAELGEGIPCYASRHAISNIVCLSDGKEPDSNSLGNVKLLAFAGIANPDFFFDGLRKLGLNIVATLCFPDHTRYDEKSLSKIERAILDAGADYAITTEKDGVKLLNLPQKLKLKILLAQLELHFNDPEALAAALRGAIRRA